MGGIGGLSEGRLAPPASRSARSHGASCCPARLQAAYPASQPAAPPPLARQRACVRSQQRPPYLVPPRDEIVDVQRQLARLLKAGGVAAVHHLEVQHLVLAAGGGWEAWVGERDEAREGGREGGRRRRSAGGAACWLAEAAPRPLKRQPQPSRRPRSQVGQGVHRRRLQVQLGSHQLAHAQRLRGEEHPWH